MYDEMATAKSEAYEDVAKQAPRLPMEMEKLAKHIAMVETVAARFVARLGPLLQPSEETAMRAMDGVPSREPSAFAGQLVAAQRQLQSIESALNDALERLEI